MKIFNTLTRKKEEFVPITPGKISMYVCGPTVYNYIHIGNARPMIVFDTFRRYMEYRGYTVNYVSNFTDVDDKIIKKANEEGLSSKEISDRYIDECKKDMAALNVRPATVHPQATKEIGGMIDMIQTLIDKGHAYVAADGTVYFRTRSFDQYGKLSHKNLDDLRTGERELKVSGEEQKEDPLDFVLWKPKKEGEPSWPSPWCDGRPGWHIECSVMSKKYLAETIDIHGGGSDLIFPHHENEIAQSECTSGKEFAHYWMHNGFLNIDNRKMSKSLGNFFTVREITEKYDPQVLRFFMQTAQYRGPLNFSAELMEQAKTSLDRIRTCGNMLKEALETAPERDLTAEEQNAVDGIREFVKMFEDAMDDDLNTADAITAIFELVRSANVNVKTASGEKAPKKVVESFYNTLELLAGILGLFITTEENAEADPEAEEIEGLIAQRKEAKKNKDFALADKIRDDLLARGIVLEDTREGTKWKRN